MNSALLFILLLTFSVINGKWFFEMERFESCKGYQNSAQVFSNSNITNTKGVLNVNYDITMTKNLPNTLETIWSLEKCRSKDELSTCRQFYSFKTGKTCDMLDKKGELWTPFVECVSPHYRCPLKKGVYYARNCTLDISLLTLLPLQEGYWKCLIYTKDLRIRKNIGCLNVEGQIKQK